MIRASRREGTLIQSAILEFDHIDSGSNVGLVAISHFGTIDYFNQISSYIIDKEAQGAIVNCEGTTDSAAMSSAAHKLRASHHNLASAMYNIMERGLGLTYESKVISHPPHWDYADMDHEEIAAHMDPSTMRMLSLGSKVLGVGLRLIPSFLARKAATAIVTSEVASGADDDSEFMFNFNDVLVSMRDNRALQALDARRAENPGQHFVMKWGEGHADGIGKGLIERNYVQTSERWLTIVDLENPPIASA